MTEPDSLTDEQRARLAALRRRGSRNAAEPDEQPSGAAAVGNRAGGIPATGRKVGPMSASQERIWFLDRFLPDSVAYHVAGTYRLHGEFSLPALRETVHALAERHPAFRTTFAMVQDVPSQILRDTSEVQIRETKPESGDPAELTTITDTFVRERFDLARGPLLRLLLTHVGPDEALLTIVVHHIVFDGWSLGVFMREFAALYRERVDGTPSELPDVPITYLDYAIWQREREAGDEFEAQREYWTNLLAAMPTVLELPTDRPRPAVQTFAGARHRFGIPDQLRAEVERLAREQATTPYVVLLSAFAILLHRWSSEPRFGCATPVANRPRVATEQVIGVFVNTLVLPMDLTGGPTFREVLHRTADTWFGSFGHQEYPFERLVDAMDSQRVLSHNPLAQVMFILQSAPARGLELAGTRLESRTTDTASTKFDLTLELFPEEQGYHGAVEYATDLFDPDTIERFVDHYVRLLEAMVADPDGRVATAPLRTEQQAERLAGWNATAADTGLGARITDPIAAELDRSADRIAVRTGDTELSYRELADRAGRVANLLRRHGVGDRPDTLVGLCLRRGPELVPALLGTLVAGGAYVPFDPDQPAERIGNLHTDAGIDVLLTTTDCLPALSRLPAHVTTIVLDDPAIRQTIADLPTTWPPIDNAHSNDRDLAYVIYTSGSTGEPKGVMIEHRSILNRIAWMQSEYGLERGDRVLQKTAYTFDVSVWELLWPLTVGATVVLASPDAPREPADLAREIRDHGVTHLHFVPTALSAFLRVQTLADTAVRRIFCSGEALPRELCERTYHDCGIAIDNLYGPTECAVDVTYWRWHPDLVGQPPIGGPVANTRAYVVDEAGNELPVGFPGELWIGGVQVGRGYLGRDDLTAERFLPDPFLPHATPDDRVYRTGDRVRRHADGLLEFLGRIDDQVKVRGFRIEPGEIEAALRGEPEVADAAVVCCQDASGDKRLVGYLVAEPGSLTAPDLPAGQDGTTSPAAYALIDRVRRRLRDRLPDYLVPATLAPISELPLSSSGKVDRARLASMAASERPSRSPSADQTPPRTDTERLVADSFGAVLNVTSVAAQDNFFDLGGDSIKSIQLAARLREAGYSVLIRSIFTHQTVARLAEFLDTEGEAVRVDAADEQPAGGPVPWTEPVPASPLQQHMMSQLPGRGSTALYTVQRILRYRGQVDPEVAAAAWHETVASTPVLRAALLPAGPSDPAGPGDPAGDDRPTQHPERVTAGEVTVRDWSHEPDAERRMAELLVAERETGFDPAVDSPARFVFLKLGPRHGCWVLTLDYRRLDGWSLTAYLGRFLATYQRVRSVSVGGTIGQAPPEHFDHQRYAIWRDERAADRGVQDWWRSRARDLRQLPVAPVQAAHHRDFTMVTTLVPRTEMNQFVRTCRQAGVTAAAGVHALWGAVQCRYDRRDRPQFAVMSSGRGADVPGIDTAIGAFMNSLPMAWTSGPDDTVRSWLTEASAALLDLLEHDMISLTELDRMAGVRPGTALFDSYLVFQNAPAVAMPDGEPGFEVVNEATVAYSAQEHRLRVDIFPGSTGPAQLVVSGYEPVERLRVYLEGLRDAIIALGSLPAALPGSMRALLDHRPPEPRPVLTAETMIAAMVANEPFPWEQA